MRVTQIIVAVAATIGFASAAKEDGKTFKIAVHVVKETKVNNFAAAASAPVKYLTADKTLAADKASGVDCTLQATTILCGGKAIKTSMVGDMGGSLSFGGTTGSSFTIDSNGWIKSSSRQLYLSPSGASGIQVENCPHGHVSQHGYAKALYN